MSIIRVKQGVQSAAWDARNQVYVSLVGGVEFDSNDPLVKEHPWAFETDTAADERSDRKSSGRQTAAPISPDASSPIEDASAVPGRKRNR